MTEQHLHWGAEALWRQLEPLLPGLSIEVVARTDSTNTRLVERARGAACDSGATSAGVRFGRRAGDTQPVLLVAEHQTQGRGRQGREWLATPLNSLTFSLALPLARPDWSGLSIAVGVALADALDPPAAPGAAAAAWPRIGLKWPNDLWLVEGPGRGRKLGGILIETVLVGERRLAIVGCGLNVLPQPAEGLAHGYASLHELDPQASAPATLARVAGPLVQALLRFDAEGFVPFATAFAARDLLRGRAVTTTAPAAPSGIADGVDATGALRVLVDGEPVTIVSGEVSVRLHGAG